MGIFQDIKSKINLREYLSKFLQFNSADMAPCPFHEDHTPSFLCRPGDDSFKCFSCGEHGDVFTFIEKYNGYSNVDAMKFLAQEMGIKLSETNSKEAVERQALVDKCKRLYEMCLKERQENPNVVKYLETERSISLATMDAYGIGYSKKLDAIYFPIRDKYGKMVGGSFRYFNPPPGRDKYCNTSNDKTEFFKKREILYCLPEVRKGIKDSIYLCEGYFDALSLNQNGFKALGLLMAMMTKDQAKTLKDTIGKDVTIVLVPDNDETGRSSVEKNYRMLRAFFPDNSIKIVLIPEGFKDINEYCIANKNEDLDCPQMREADSFMKKAIAVEVYLAGEYLDAESDPQKQFTKVRDFIKSVESPMLKSLIVRECANYWNKDVPVVETFFNTKATGSTDILVEDADDLLARYEYFIKNINNSRIRLKYKELEKIIRGVNMGEVVTIMARSSVGKTAFILNLLSIMTRGTENHAILFSLEQQSAQIAERMLCMSSGMKMEELERLFNNNRDRAFGVISQYNEWFKNVYVADKDSVSLEDMEKVVINSNMTRHPVNIVAIDYMGYIKTKYAADPYVSVSNTSKELKAFAKRLNISLFVLHQLSREGGCGGIPVTMRMARDSGVVEESADIILGAWRPDLAEGMDFIAKDIAEKESKFKIEVIKNRSGRCGRATLKFEKECLRITDYNYHASSSAPGSYVEPEHEEPPNLIENLGNQEER